MSPFSWKFVDRILTHGNDLCLLMNASVNAYRRLDPHFEAPNQLKASAMDRGSMVRIPIGNSRSARLEVRAVAPDANPYLVLYGIFKTGIEGDIAEIENLRNAPRYLPDNIYDAIENFDKSEWTTKLLGEDVKGRYADLKKSRGGPLPACARHRGEGAGGAVPSRGLHAISVEYVLKVEVRRQPSHRRRRIERGCDFSELWGGQFCPQPAFSRLSRLKGGCGQDWPPHSQPPVESAGSRGVTDQKSEDRISGAGPLRRMFPLLGW